ncbi:hypothetical protein ACSW9O_15455 (plasmid) [Clostridium perfringens]
MINYERILEEYLKWNFSIFNYNDIGFEDDFKLLRIYQILRWENRQSKWNTIKEKLKGV